MAGKEKGRKKRKQPTAKTTGKEMPPAEDKATAPAKENATAEAETPANGPRVEGVDDTSAPATKKRKSRKPNAEGEPNEPPAISIPSEEEIVKQGGIRTHDTVTANHVYSNVYRKKLSQKHTKEEAQTAAKYNAAIFRAYKMYLPNECGVFRGPRKPRGGKAVVSEGAEPAGCHPPAEDANA